MRVVAALSGGVDSSVAAALLLQEDHDVVGVFLRNGVAPGAAPHGGRRGCCGVADAADAARVADVLGVPFYSLDFSAGFGAIVEDFARAYASGLTPNPCVSCNRDLKFGELLRFADALGADAVATGHYAAAAARDGRAGLRVPADRRKDQTYVLFPLPQGALRRARFPLAGLTKDAVRAEAARLRLPVADKAESMELCFVPDGDYRTLLSERAPQALRAGDVVDAATGAVVGRHAGFGSVTVGQRRGLGSLGPRPRYVAGIDAERNVVTVTDGAGLDRRVVVVRDWNDVSVVLPRGGGAVRGFAKVRRSMEPRAATARVDLARPGFVRVEFDGPVRAPAPGQALVLYDEDGWVLGGGWIVSASR